ncbi:MAG: hypothetical protein ACTSR8_02045 [Promethearchaeota archaeon]
MIKVVDLERELSVKAAELDEKQLEEEKKLRELKEKRLEEEKR